MRHRRCLLVCAVWAALATAPRGATAQIVEQPPAQLVPWESGPGDVELTPTPQPFSNPTVSPPTFLTDENWTWQVVPEGLIYRSYLAGNREPRFATQWVSLDGHWYMDGTLGGRAAVLRYGSVDALFPQGFEVDIEGAAFPRLDLQSGEDLNCVDFRVGVPLTFRTGPWETKLALYHLSSHLGDEFMQSHPGVTRINYSRNVVVLGLGLRPNPDWRLYGEAGYAAYTDGGSRPWEFQFGIEYSPGAPSGLCGTPFFAINAHLRQEVNYGGSFTVETGWQWRGLTGRLARIGVIYTNGKSDQYEKFFTESDQQIGLGIWYDF